MKKGNHIRLGVDRHLFDVKFVGIRSAKVSVW
jgi:hypothetical protein